LVHTYNLSYSGDGSRRIKVWRLAQSKLARPFLKNKIQNKKASGLAQVVESLPNMYKALGSVPSTEKKKEQKWLLSRARWLTPVVLDI
jgi:hypothetical protein